MRKKFESRSWKKEETFHEYVHDKIIFGNRIPINDEEISDYIIDGIPDNILRDQAHIQRFNNIQALLEAFDKIILRDHHTTQFNRQEKKSNISTRSEKNKKIETNSGGIKKTTIKKRCYNGG